MMLPVWTPYGATIGIFALMLTSIIMQICKPLTSDPWYCLKFLALDDNQSQCLMNPDSYRSSLRSRLPDREGTKEAPTPPIIQESPSQ
jgi:hypothetical protein